MIYFSSDISSDGLTFVYLITRIYHFSYNECVCGGGGGGGGEAGVGERSPHCGQIV